jgi:hypothetical protein
MMKESLESFVRENKKDFDQFEPPADLWNKIEKQLDEKKIGITNEIGLKKERVVRVSFLLKVAATLIPILFAGLWFYQYQLKQSTDLSNIDPLLAKQQIHYASLIEIKRSELKLIEKEEPQLYQEFSSEIKKMDASYQKLKNDLPASPNQEETVKAMIRNLQIQTELLNQQLQIIQQINQIKKEQKNETQNI